MRVKFLKYASGHFKANKAWPEWLLRITRNFEARYAASKELATSLCYCFLSMQATTVSCVSEKLYRCRPMLDTLSSGTCSFFVKSPSGLRRLFVLVYTGYKIQWAKTSVMIIAYFKSHFASLESLQPSVIHLMLSKTGFRQNIIHLTLSIYVFSAMLYSLQRSRCQNPEVDPEAKQKRQCTNNGFFSIIICLFSSADLPLPYSTPSHIELQKW